MRDSTVMMGFALVAALSTACGDQTWYTEVVSPDHLVRATELCQPNGGIAAIYGRDHSMNSKLVARSMVLVCANGAKFEQRWAP